MKTTAALAVLTLLLGCPAAPDAPTSVDGLAGGALTSDLSAPAVSATSLSFTDANGQSLAVNDIAATNVTVSGMTVTAGLARPGTTLINVLGFPIGTASRETARGYLGVNERCAAQFPAVAGEAAAAHMCSQQEIHLAVQTDPAAIPESIVGAAYSTFFLAPPSTAAIRAARSSSMIAAHGEQYRAASRVRLTLRLTARRCSAMILRSASSHRSATIAVTRWNSPAVVENI